MSSISSNVISLSSVLSNSNRYSQSIFHAQNFFFSFFHVSFCLVFVLEVEFVLHILDSNPRKFIEKKDKMEWRKGNVVIQNTDIKVRMGPRILCFVDYGQIINKHLTNREVLCVRRPVPLATYI